MIVIKKYEDLHHEEWDNFVNNLSCNGTFLQTKNFLDYHSEETFIDHSLMFIDNEKILAVMPAHLDKENPKNLISHNGSTYGGLIFNKKYYKASRVQEVIETLENYLFENGFEYLLLKLTPSIFSQKSPDLLKYLLTLNGFEAYSELSTYVDLINIEKDILMTFDETKRKIVRRLEKKNITLKRLSSDEDIKEFYNLLELNLEKHGIKPIHSFENLLDFKNERITNNVEFFGVYIDEILCSAGMMFLFEDIKIAHAQNLSTDPNSEYADTITYLYYSMIKTYKERGYKYLSWGKSTEEKGKILNYHLLRNKESYGSNYNLNYTFFKSIKNQ